MSQVSPGGAPPQGARCPASPALPPSATDLVDLVMAGLTWRGGSLGGVQTVLTVKLRLGVGLPAVGVGGSQRPLVATQHLG